MKNNNQAQEAEHKHAGSNASSALAGFVIGGLAGASAALLFAPQSGKETRAQIQQKSLEIRDQAVETVDDAVAQVKSKTHEISDNVRGKAKELQHQGQEMIADQMDHVRGKAEEFQHKGQEMIADQLDRVAAAAEAGKVAIAPEPEKAPVKKY
jgi:gas vesicle protein